MKKFVLISALSLLFFYCDAQKELGKLLGVSAGYVPWGVERLECASADGLDDYTWKGRYSFKNPTLLLGFEIRNEVVSSLIELSFSSFFVDKIDSANKRLGTYNIKQIGLAYHPGLLIMPRRRFQIPLRVGLGFNYYFHPWGGPRMENNLFVTLCAAAQFKFYVSNQVALYAGYSIHGGLALKYDERFRINGLGFKHYPEIGVLVNFKVNK